MIPPSRTKERSSRFKDDPFFLCCEGDREERTDNSFLHHGQRDRTRLLALSVRGRWTRESMSFTTADHGAVMKCPRL